MRPPSSYFKVKDEEDPVRRGDGADPIRPLRASLNYVKRPISLADRPPASHCSTAPSPSSTRPFWWLGIGLQLLGSGFRSGSKGRRGQIGRERAEAFGLVGNDGLGRCLPGGLRCDH